MNCEYLSDAWKLHRFFKAFFLLLKITWSHLLIAQKMHVHCRKGKRYG